jgi:hypothetical protein
MGCLIRCYPKHSNQLGKKYGKRSYVSFAKNSLAATTDYLFCFY